MASGPQNPRVSLQARKGFKTRLETPGNRPQNACVSHQVKVGFSAARGADAMVKFLLFCVLLVLCWPLALLALVAYPFVWLILLPFRLVGIAVGGVLELVAAIIFLPARMLRAI